jgi:ribonuclease HI
LIKPPKVVNIYTDGACSGNPGPGGYGIVLLHGKHAKELSRGFRQTTNNRMELLAAVVGLRALNQRCEVHLYSDSQYVVQGIEAGWARRWMANSWRRERNKVAANWDLWRDLLAVLDRHDVSFHWVRGHNGDPYNERCDELAVAASQRRGLDVDNGYESPQAPPA